MEQIADAINTYAIKLEAPLASIFDKAAPQIGLLVGQHAAPVLSKYNISTVGARLVVTTAAAAMLLTVIAAMTSLLSVGLQALSLVLVARNSIKAIEGGQRQDTKAILAYLCIMMTVDFIQKTHLSIVLDAIPFFSVMKSFFMLICSTPSTGVAMKVYGAVAEPYFRTNSAASNSPVSTSTAPVAPSGFVCTVGSASGLLEGSPLYCMLSLVKGSDQTMLSKDCFLTAVCTQHQWAQTLTMPYSSEASLLAIAIKEKQQFGSDTDVGKCSIPLSKLGPEPAGMKIDIMARGGDEVIGILSIAVSLNK